MKRKKRKRGDGSMQCLKEREQDYTLDEFLKSSYKDNPVYVEEFETFLHPNTDLTPYREYTLRPTELKSVQPYNVTENYVRHLEEQGMYVEGQEIYAKLQAVDELMQEITAYYQEREGDYIVLQTKQIKVG